VGVATGERLYVLRLDPERNAAVVGTREEITRTAYTLGDVRFVAGRPPATELATTVVLRYRGTPLAARLAMRGEDARLTLDRPALVAPGQAAVFYDGDEVIGGGVVKREVAEDRRGA
jgi:tRNA-specific 2-thiouridylase